MHEVAIVEDLMEIVEESARVRNITRVHKIKIVVGKKTAALPDSLQFCFEALSTGTIMDGAVLEIEETAGRDFYVDYFEGE